MKNRFRDNVVINFGWPQVLINGFVMLSGAEAKEGFEWVQPSLFIFGLILVFAGVYAVVSHNKKLKGDGDE